MELIDEKGTRLLNDSRDRTNRIVSPSTCFSLFFFFAFFSWRLKHKWKSTQDKKQKNTLFYKQHDTRDITNKKGQIK